MPSLSTSFSWIALQLGPSFSTPPFESGSVLGPVLCLGFFSLVFAFFIPSSTFRSIFPTEDKDNQAEGQHRTLNTSKLLKLLISVSLKVIKIFMFCRSCQ